MVDESGSTAETVRIDELDADTSDVETELPDLPTAVELADTVRIDESEPSEFAYLAEQHENEEPSNIEALVDSSPMSDAAVAPIELDPLPSDEEIQAVDVGDVELSELDAGTAVPDADAIEAEADPESINVGDLLGEDEPTGNSIAGYPYASWGRIIPTRRRFAATESRSGNWRTHLSRSILR